MSTNCNESAPCADLRSRTADAECRESGQRPGQVMSRLTLSCEERPCEPSRRAQVARQHSGWLWSALAGLMVLTGLAAPAAAQTVQTLVSNTSESRPLSGASSILAASISTGDHRNGYTISQLELHMFEVASRSTTVKLYSNSSSGEPQNLLATFTNTVSLASRALNTYTAPPNTTLSKNTTYWIVVNEDISDSSQRVSYSTTRSKNDTSSYGWSIGNKRLIKSTQTAVWRTSTFSVLSLAVRGNLTSGSSPLTVTISDVPDTSSEPFTATFTFLETVTGFTVDDITLTNATASSFMTTTTPGVYTALITPTADGAGLVDLHRVEHWPHHAGIEPRRRCHG